MCFANPADGLLASPSATNLEANFKACQCAHMQDDMTIGQLARAVGLADSTIRYYEREGLLEPAGRTASNYRFYGPEAGARLVFIRAAKAAGFELTDIKSMLAFQDGRVAPCDEVRELVEARLVNVRRQLHKLKHVEHVLLEFQRACERRRRAKGCPVLETLSPPSLKRSRAR
jgi:MerR family mercuric resistance operon transcriptional regulator